MASKIKNMSPQILVTDIDRAIEFYTATLGFTLNFRYEDFYAGILKEGCSIHLKADARGPGENVKKNNGEHVSVIFNVTQIESLYEELSHSGAAFAQPLRDMPYGREFYVADPDGNVIAFLE